MYLCAGSVFFLACEDLGKGSPNHSPLALFLFYLFSGDQLAHPNSIIFDQDQTTVAQQYLH